MSSLTVRSSPDLEERFILIECRDARAKEDVVRLIRAADDMLAALRVALRAPGIHTTDQDTGETFAETIRAAIAKAKGQA